MRRIGSHGSRASSSGTPSMASQYSAFSNSRAGGISPSRRSKGLTKLMSTTLAQCFGREKSKSETGELDSTREASEVSQLASARTSERRSRRAYVLKNDFSHREQEPPGMKFTMDDITKATNNFSPSYKIGQGGFGTVYRGLLNGKVVAIKRGRKNVYDKHVIEEFQSEISTLSCIEHLNLVKYFGCLETNEEKILVVEYVPNGTLREHLDGTRGRLLDFSARLDIAVDVAHAITYLHMYADRPIIHRDIKSSNILLTNNLRAKVADFGFARLGQFDDGKSKISTQIKGTAGYMDPEYLQTCKLTEKSDVYSFGILLVELVTGRRPIESKMEIRDRLTARWAMKKFADGEAIQVLDPNLPQNQHSYLALEKTLELAYRCLAPTRHSRPSMRSCAEVLWSIRKEYRDLLTSEPSETLSILPLSME